MKIVIDSDNLFHDCLLALTLIVIFQFYWYGRRIIRFLWSQLGKNLIDKVKRNGRIKRKVTPVLVPERSRSLSIPPSPNGKDSPSHQGLRKARIGLRLSGSNLNMGPERGRTSPLTIGNSPGHSSFLSISSGDIFNDYEISYTRPSSKVKLEWVSKPKTILLVKKWKDYYVTSCLSELIEWIRQEHPEIALMVEPETYKELGHMKHVNFTLFDTSLVAQEADQVDLIICLGGDGTVLHISSLFQRSVPPIMAFNLGSMGFLTPFNFKNFKEDLKPVLRGKCFIKLRLRLHCTIIKKGVEQLDLDYHALNEATIDRGASPFLSHLECYCDDKLITTVQADGIIVATATGSTAYSLSSGGSLVHPLLPALLFTPICPHSLSFRPVVLPSSVTLKVMIPPESHCSASISFDGRHRQELHPGDGVVMRISEWPVATVSKTDQIGEWFSSLAQHLNWNKRVFQKSKKEDNKREEFNKKEELKKEEELKREETTKMTETFFNLRASM